MVQFMAPVIQVQAVLAMPIVINDPTSRQVGRLALLRQVLNIVKPVEKEYNALRIALLGTFHANGDKPLTCPGWTVAFSGTDMPSYHVDAYKKWNVAISHVVQPPVAVTFGSAS